MISVSEKTTAVQEKAAQSISDNAIVTPIVSFIGNSNSGKTTLLEKVVAELKILGYRVATVKHTPHGCDIDHPGKDTWRLARAGSDIVVLSSSDRFAFIERLDDELSLDQIRETIGGKVDVILAEGYKSSEIPKVVVRNTGQRAASLKNGGEVLVTISAQLSDTGAPQFDPRDVADIVSLLVELIGQRAD